MNLFNKICNRRFSIKLYQTVVFVTNGSDKITPILILVFSFRKVMATANEDDDTTKMFARTDEEKTDVDVAVDNGDVKKYKKRKKKKYRKPERKKCIETC